jgi:hypothetical protein
MIKVIELDIDPELSGDTGVFEVALVEYPAIEQELIYFSRQKFYKATDEISKVACQAIKENEKRGNPAATQVGKVRGQQLCNRSEISLETVKRMYSYLERAKVYNTNDWDDNGTISWKLWGGQPALDWSKRILDSLEKKEENMATIDEKGNIKESKKAPKSDTPNKDPKGEGTAKGSAENTRSAKVSEKAEKTLQNKSDNFNEKHKDKLGYGATVGMLKSVYQRGLGAYNSSRSPFVKSAEQWAQARVNAFLYLLKNGRPENAKYITDYDLLPSGHPKKSKMSSIDFVKPEAGEDKQEFISRCIAYLVKNEDKEQDQAAAMCYSMWDQDFADEYKEQKFSGDRVSFDWDRSLTSQRGRSILEMELQRGNVIYIISDKNRVSLDMLDFAREYNIPGNNVFALNSNIEKVKKVKDLGVRRHYDNDPNVIRDLQSVGMAFDYDTSALPDFVNYPESGDTKAMLVKPILKPVLFNDDCGCEAPEEFAVIAGYIDGFPVFATEEDAKAAATEMGCNGAHEHRDENGDILYMPCETHPDYDEDEIELYNAFKALKATLEFEKRNNAVVDIIRSGFFDYEIFGKTVFRNGQKFYRYVKKPEYSGIGDTRTFCESIEGKYFRRAIIDQMDDLNFEFGHGKDGGNYSKWSFKGGPNCVHAWKEAIYKFEVNDDGVRINERLEEGGYAPGLAGTAPRAMSNNGYYDKDTKKASEKAYAISQSYSAAGNNDGPFNVLYGDLAPLYYIEGLPIYGVELQAMDASYAIGCGGVIETITLEGKEYFMACSKKARKVDMQKMVFAVEEEKRMVYTPLMIPNILIPRMDEITGERYFVKFIASTIRKIQRKFMIEQRLSMTNLEHSEKKFKDIIMVESWIVEGDKDKAYELGFTKDQIQKGTWMAGYTVLDTEEGNEIWEKYIKPGKVKGASVEGNFILNFSTFSKDDYLLKKIINILKQIS